MSGIAIGVKYSDDNEFKCIRRIATKLGLSTPESDDDILCLSQYRTIERAINAAFRDLNKITEQEKVIGELETLVESAFREGYSLGYGDGNSDGQSYCGKPCRDDELQWNLSDAIEELAKHKQSKGERDVFKQVR